VSVTANDAIRDGMRTSKAVEVESSDSGAELERQLSAQFLEVN
jgi:hypothetical protein